MRCEPSETQFELPLVSLVDCLLCIVFFLLSSFAARTACAERVRVPSAEHFQALHESPVVVVTRRQILLDGVPAADVPTIAARGRVSRIPYLFEQLRAKRELFTQLSPGIAFPGSALLQIDRDIPAIIVKSVLYTVRQAGYPETSLLVYQR